MPLVSLCLLAGAYALQWMPALPDVVVFISVLPAALLLLMNRYGRLPGGVLLGFAVMGIAATQQLNDRLNPDLQPVTVETIVTIEEFPTNRNGLVSMVAAPQNADHLPARLRLSWLEPSVVPQIGEAWRFEARLRRPYGYANPGGFDFEGLLFRSKIGATGYIVQDGQNYRVHGVQTGLMQEFRRRVVDRLGDLLPEGEAAAVLMAIVVGARHAISRAQWTEYADTGTSHLMAISGLHIGLAAGAVYVLALVTLALAGGRCNYRDYALLAALLTGVCYAAMSGFAVPARRAAVMLLIAGVLILRRREVSPFALLAVTVGLIFFADPLAVLAPGFKMSFAAVAVLFIAARHHVVLDVHRWLHRPLAQLLRLAYVQFALLIGLMPLTIVLFDRFNVIAPLVNIAVLPIFNFVTVPVSIAGALLDGPAALVGDQLLLLAHKSVEVVLAIIATAARAESLRFTTAVADFSPRQLLLLSALLVPIVLPAGWPGRRLVLLAAASIVVARQEPPPTGCFAYHVLDVGQGLAVVVRTRNHVLLFDTGPAFQSGNSTAELVIQPFLQFSGIDRLDVVVVSHGDLDHAGGIRPIIRSGDVGRVLGGESIPTFGSAVVPCVAGRGWQWDGIDFRVLHPRNRTAWDGNNLSCVVEVSAGSRRLLLTGDIESPVEKLLLYRQLLRASDVVVVPHHGSRTSSSDALVAATAPAVAIVSAGRMNRWGFPRPEVVQRWRRAGAYVANTAQSGAVSQQLCADGVPGALKVTRTGRRAYWHEDAAELP